MQVHSSARALRFGPLGLVLALLVPACGDLGTATDLPPAQQASSTDGIEVWWPTDGAALTGTQPFKAVLSGWSLKQYRMYWQVDGGQLNAMYDSHEGGAHKEALVDVDGWTWRGSGPYQVTFVARDKRNKTTLGSASVSITVGSAPAAPVASVEVTPATLSLELGASATLAAVLRDADGNTLSERVVTWSSSALDVVAVDGAGAVTAWGEGSAVVTATSEGVSGAASVTVTAAPPPTGSPFEGHAFYVDPYSNARMTADAWRDTRPADALEMEKIAGQAQADWFGGWSGDIQAAVANRVTTIMAAGALPVLVAYNIPGRDCNGYSAGGSSTADAYRQWIADFAAGLAGRKAVVVLEPDALAQLDCLPSADQQSRLTLLLEAVRALGAQGARVYLDGGHARWKAADVMAARLREAGVAEAAGFSLNVSNFLSNTESRGYGEAISSYLGGGARFIIDSSRNGLGPTADAEWCNPDGRALGTAPTAATNHSLVDAYFWIKRPGESDGTCNGGPSAGTWWADYALGLAVRQTETMATATVRVAGS
ncbi:MAG TPA: glycoside hydrolase family 6 protein [Longimicrobiales bacterium]|nr:glycoside hydrolase family 6 protein [Longimicrobiales bacterium]